MAENLQTTQPAEEGWTTVIRPKTGWFDIDLQEPLALPRPDHDVCQAQLYRAV